VEIASLALTVGGLAMRAGASPSTVALPAAGTGTPGAMAAIQATRRAGAQVLRLAGAGAG